MTGDLLVLKQSLSRTPFFGGLLDQSLEGIIGMLTERTFDKDAVVVREGDVGKSLFIIQSGSLVVCRAGESGCTVRLVRLGPGDFFGEMALIEVQPRSTTVKAEVPSRLLELTNMDLYRLYMQDVQAYVMVLQNMNRELCRRLRKADRRITQMAEENGEETTQIGQAFDPRSLKRPESP